MNVPRTVHASETLIETYEQFYNIMFQYVCDVVKLRHLISKSKNWGCFKNAYELLNLRAPKMSMLGKSRYFVCVCEYDTSNSNKLKS